MAHSALYKILLLSFCLGVCCGQQTINVTWSLDNISEPMVLTANLGDSLSLVCPEGVYSEIVQLDDSKQLEQCNYTSINVGDTKPKVVGSCLGTFKAHSIPLRTPSGMLAGANSFVVGGTYYFTSYSPVNASFSNAHNHLSGGQCLEGLKLTLMISPEPTDPTHGTVPGGSGFLDTDTTGSANVGVNTGGTSTNSPLIPGIEDTDVPITGDIAFLNNSDARLGQTYLMIIPALLFVVLFTLQR